ncbi:uncharacterized protein B0H64DRAFT_415985 [Chaetomium fimeti]|uniref:FAD-binding domain-containing protein n=1 Tax=Chaetomium fimeti TaxID=1854472 RepID=A0AAE0HI31_9PEZI|nr:hypothetical protein B0H64DRAFT_415985 [Chaetomium fimeti]
MEPLRVLIIGGGNAGISATVFEKDESTAARARDWSFGVYWAQSRIEECLTPELNLLLDTVQTDPSYRRHAESVLPVYHGVTGEILQPIPAPYAIRLKRRAFVDMIKKGLDVRYGKSLDTITVTEGGITAGFKDGTAENGTLLIGAEGAHSPTRAWLFQLSPEDAALQKVPVSSFGTVAKLTRETALSLRNIHPIYSMAVGPDNVFVFAAIHDCTAEAPEDWTFMLLITWNYDETEDHVRLANDRVFLLEKVEALTKSLVYPFNAMVQDVPPETRSWYSSQMTYWPTRPWDNRGGRVTVAGDAAHAMTFHRGQGLGNAVADVTELQTRLRAMKGHTRQELARAVGGYEKEVWKRGYDVVMENRENTLAVHDWENVLRSPLLVKGVARQGSLQGSPAQGGKE